MRWYEFRVNQDKARGVALHQPGTYAPEGFYPGMPSPATDKYGGSQLAHPLRPVAARAPLDSSIEILARRFGARRLRGRTAAEGKL